jgi:hypothetical protein
MEVLTPFYDCAGRKYIDVIFNSQILKLKIPFRYGRVMCRVEGLKTIQEFKKGEFVDIVIQKKKWDGLEFLVVESIKECSHGTES